MTGEQLHLEWLRKKRADYEDELAGAEATIARLKPLIAHLSGVIQALESEQEPQGVTAPDQTGRASSLTIDHQRAAPVKTGHMPHRRQEFEAMTAATAIMKVLESQPRKFHADEIAHAVFTIQTREEFDAAKRAVVSELIRGSHRGILRKLGGNYFMAARLITPEPSLPSDTPMTTRSRQEPAAENYGHQDNSDPQFPLEIAQQERSSANASRPHRAPMKPGTLKYECYLLFKELGQFMWPRELAEKLSQKGVRIDHPSPAELLGGILRKSIHRNQRLFGRNTGGKYGLLEWLGNGHVISELTRHDDSDTVENEDPPSVTWEGLE